MSYKKARGAVVRSQRTIDASEDLSRLIKRHEGFLKELSKL